MLDTMLEPKLKSPDYYIDKLSMFMKGCNGIPDQVEMLVDVLNQLDDASEYVIDHLNITKDDVFMSLVENAESREEGEFVDILTKLGNLYGVSQHFTLSFVEGGTRETHEVNLTPFEFWLLIKAQILQNCFDGSYGQTREYYDKMKLPVYIFTNASYASALMILNTSVPIEVGSGNNVRSYPITTNIEYLFKAGYFTIKSMGIVYSTDIVDIEHIGVWDSILATKLWDSAQWGS